MAETVPQPSGQTDPIFFYLAHAFLHPSDTCPDYDVIDAEGREGLLALNAAIDKAGGVPLDVEAQEIYAEKLDLDYWIQGTVTVDQVTGTVERWYSDLLEDWYGPNVVGNFTLQMEIYDPHHKQVVKQGQTSWSGTINSREGLAAAESLGESFGSLSVIMHDYERKPIRAIVEPEFDPVLAGEEISLLLTNIRGDGGQPQPWWRIFVKVRQGEIANGEPEEEGYRWLRVGDGPSVEVRYRAPESCHGDEITEEITVKNTCNMTEHYVGTPEDDIAASEFQIVCSSYELDYDYPYTVIAGPVRMTIPIQGRVPFHAERGAGDQILLVGGGDLTAPIQGAADNCALQGKMTLHVTVSGALVPAESGRDRLIIDLQESPEASVVEQCPDKAPESIPLPFPPVSYTVEMDALEGFVVESPHAMGFGIHTLTLYQR